MYIQWFNLVTGIPEKDYLVIISETISGTLLCALNTAPHRKHGDRVYQVSTLGHDVMFVSLRNF